MKHTFAAVFLFLAILFSGCSSQNEYKGYIPVTQAEAEAYGKRFVEMYNQGDKSEFLEIATDVDALVAACIFKGMDYPGAFRNPTPEGYKVHADQSRNSNSTFAEATKSLEFLEVVPSGKTFGMVLERKSKSKEKTGIKDVYTLVKKKDGRIAIGGLNMAETRAGKPIR